MSYRSWEKAWKDGGDVRKMVDDFLIREGKLG